MADRPINRATNRTEWSYGSYSSKIHSWRSKRDHVSWRTCWGFVWFGSTWNTVEPSIPHPLTRCNSPNPYFLLLIHPPQSTLLLPRVDDEFNLVSWFNQIICDRVLSLDLGPLAKHASVTRKRASIPYPVPRFVGVGLWIRIKAWCRPSYLKNKLLKLKENSDSKGLWHFLQT